MAERDDVSSVHEVLLELGYVLPLGELEPPQAGNSTTAALAKIAEELNFDVRSDSALDALRIEAQRRRGDIYRVGEVRGLIVDDAGYPVAGAMVRALSRGLRTDDVIGQARTGTSGAFSIRYRARPALALVVWARHGKQTVESPVRYQPPPLVEISLAFGVGVYPGPSEFDAMIAVIAPLLDGVAAYALSKNDVAVLAKRSGLDGGRLQLFAWAEKRGKENHIAPVILYALARAGLPTALPALGAQPATALSAAIERAIASNVVAPSARATLADAIARLQKLALATPPTQATPAAAVLAPIFTTLKLAADVQTKLFQLATDTNGSTDDRWTKIAADSTLAPHIDGVQLGLRLSAIARNVQPLVAALQRRIPSLDKIGDLATLTLDDWRGLVAKSGVPDGTPGATAADQNEAFAQQLRRTIEVLMPMETLRARLGDTQVFASSPVPAFLTRHIDFSFVTDHPDDYASRAEPTANASLLAELKRMQRLFRLTPRASELTYLWSKGFQSAADVAKMGRASFLAAHAQGLGDVDRAGDMFSRATQIAAASALLFGQFAPATHGLPMRVLPAIKPTST